MKAEELQHGRIYKVTRDVMSTWSVGDLLRCDRTTSITRLVVLKYKRINARSTHSANLEFQHVLAALEPVE